MSGGALHSDVIDRPAWYAITTKRSREDFAAARLAQRGIASYLPLVREERDAVDVRRPMFPGYLLIRILLARDFHRVLWSPGVRHFVSFGGGPVPIDDGTVRFLRQQEDADGVIRRRCVSTAGNLVQITDGPFRGLTAIVERRLPARDRVLVFLDLLRRQTRVDLPSGWVRPN